MPAFSLPVVVRTAAGEIGVVIDLPAPTAIAQVLPDIRRCADLPPGTPIYLGAGLVEGSLLCGQAPLLAGCVLTTAPDDVVREVGPVALSCVAGPDAGGSAVLTAGGVTVGRDPACDLAAADPELSRRHACVRPSGTGVTVVDLQSVNGIGVDGVTVQRGVGSGGASTEAVCQVPAGALLRLGGSLFRVGLVAEQRVLVTPDGQGRLAVSRPARVLPGFTAPLGDPPGPAPLRSRRPIPVLSAAVGAVAGGAIAWVTGMWMFLLLAALGPVMLVAGAMSDRVSGRRSHRRMAAEHRQEAERYRHELDRAVAADRTDAWDRYPDPATLARRVPGAGVRLWERRRHDEDFLRLTLGVGVRPARLPVPEPPPVGEAPITVDLAEVGVLGLAGDCRSSARWLLAQLVSLHSPADLRLSVFSGDPDLAAVSDLPHAAGDGGPGLITSLDQAGPEIDRLLAGIHGPSRGRGSSGTSAALTVVVLDDAHRWRRLAGMGELLASARAGRRGGGGVVAICLSPSAEGLPMECAAVATIGPGQLRIASVDELADCEPTGVSAPYFQDLTRALTPLFDRDAAGGGLPGRVLLSELITGDVSAHLTLAWRSPSMTAVLGMAAAGPLHIDLERDGPHALIAGTTGAGKSELLQTLVTGLALAAPPERTSFLLVDYKGGAAFGRLADLPHTTAVVTDLDPATAARALIGLRAEVRRREQVLAAAGVPDLAVLRRVGRAGVPPSLVIVVDEYATLGAELPDFLTGLLDIAQRGRSLGLHLVLATQRPAGVLSPAMKANIALRICLRVEDDADSVDVLDTGDAAGLSPAHPGRALLRRERGTVTLFQVATVSVPADRGHRVRRRNVGSADGVPPPAGRPDADLVVQAARAAAPGDRPPPPWLPVLPTDYPPPSDDVLGLIDEPTQQRQRPWRAAAGSILVVGPPASGRSSFLRRVGWSAATDGADLLVVDTGGELADLATWAAVCSHLDGRDPALVQRLVRRVMDELRNRANRPGPPLVVLLDDWDILGRELDALDFGVSTAAVAEAAAHGLPLAVRVVVAGDLRLQHHRMAGSFGGLLRLGVDHRGEIAPRTAGRGLWEGSAVQCAHSPADPVGPGARVDGPRTGIVVRPLPAEVMVTQLPAARPGAIPIGVGGDEAAPVCLDLRGPGGGLLVAGARRSGVTGTLDVLALGAAAAGIRVLRGCLRPATALPGVRDVDLRRGTAELVDLLVDHEGPLLLVVDEVESWRDIDAGLLERFLSAVGSGQHLALGCRLDRALRSLRGPVAEVAALRTGVLLGADASDGALLGTVIPRRRGPGAPGRGHLVIDGVAQVLQVAQASGTVAASGEFESVPGGRRNGGSGAGNSGTPASNRTVGSDV